MRNILLLLLISIIITSCGNSDEKKSNQLPNETDVSYLILPNSAGRFTLDDEIPDSVRGFTISKTVETRYTESGPEERPVYTVSKNGKSFLALFPEYDTQTDSYNKTIDEIMVLSPLYETEKDIGIGSTLQEFTTTYPDYKLWFTYVSDRYILENQQEGIQFLLREKDFTGELSTIKSEKAVLQPADFSEGAQIYKIRIY